jgi:dolichyl-phosphate-mannose--protein O-mannosyl transferase
MLHPKIVAYMRLNQKKSLFSSWEDLKKKVSALFYSDAKSHLNMFKRESTEFPSKKVLIEISSVLSEETLMNQTMKNIFSVRSMLLVLSVLFICRAISMAQMPLTDPSEARYGNISSNMAITGNFLEPQFIYNGVFQNFEGKPPLYFQLAGIACKIFGVNEFSVRFPALLSALCILLIIFITVRRLRDEETAVIAVLFCALTPVFLVFSGACVTDLLLSLAISGAVCFYMLFSAESEKKRKKIFSMLFFSSLGVGMMVKGPVTLVLAGMPTNSTSQALAKRLARNR